ncbi:phasin [Methyloraptor flagellatus]|jgi:phasin|uniref:Phasin n=1 Tax=Methyloraptor flagellatus TaxID=3162530 RepID=A0AAU7XD91_9HYPH
MTDIKTTPEPKKTVKAAPAAEKVTAEAPKFEFPKFELPKFEMPKFDFAAMPSAEVPAAFRDMAEKSVAQAKASYEKMKTAAEEATDLLEDTYETARAGLLEVNVKTLDAIKSNTDATFGFAKDLLAVKTLAEAVELQTAFVRKHFEAVTAQAKDLQASIQKVATETAEPVKEAVNKTLKDLKVA